MKSKEEKQKIKQQLDEAGFENTGLWVVGVILVAAIIFGIGFMFRYKGSKQGEGYKYVEGELIDLYDTEEHIGRRRLLNTHIKVRYYPEGSDKAYETSTGDAYLYVGSLTKFRVYYKEDDPNDAFIMRNDWLTRSYVPVNKNYDVTVVISGMIFLSGIYLIFDKARAKKRIATRKDKNAN